MLPSVWFHLVLLLLISVIVGNRTLSTSYLNSGDQLIA